MNDHEISAIVNELRDIAINFHAAQQLRSRIQDCIVDHLKRLQTAERRVQEQAKVFQSMADAYDCRSELFTSAEECATNLADRARSALCRPPKVVEKENLEVSEKQ